MVDNLTKEAENEAAIVVSTTDYKIEEAQPVIGIEIIVIIHCQDGKRNFVEVVKAVVSKDRLQDYRINFNSND